MPPTISSPDSVNISSAPSVNDVALPNVVIALLLKDALAIAPVVIKLMRALEVEIAGSLLRVEAKLVRLLVGAAVPLQPLFVLGPIPTVVGAAIPFVGLGL